MKKLKTEHAGAKNGGGYWGTREEAKRRSKKARRSAGKAGARLEGDPVEGGKQTAPSKGGL